MTGNEFNGRLPNRSPVTQVLCFGVGRLVYRRSGTNLITSPDGEFAILTYKKSQIEADKVKGNECTSERHLIPSTDTFNQYQDNRFVASQGHEDLDGYLYS